VGEATQQRGRGRHTSLVGAAPDGSDAADLVFGAWPPTPTPPTPTHLTGLGAGGARVYIRGEEPGAAAETMVLGGLARVRRALPATAVAPVRPRYRWHGRLALVGAGLVLLVVAGYLGIPPLLSALGLGPQVVCRVCQFPIPSSAAIGPGSGSSPGPSPVSSSPAPRPSPPARTASASATAPIAVAVPPPATATGSAPAPALEVSYTALPAGGGFIGQITVANRGSTAISGWRLVVALPGDTVSAVQNAEFSEDADVLFMTPAPYDLSVAPGNDVTVSIYASGPVRTPAECSFNGVACR
jgi:hypothetical protein